MSYRQGSRNWRARNKRLSIQLSIDRGGIRWKIQKYIAITTIASIGMVAKDAQGNQSPSWGQEITLLATVLNRMRRTNQMGNWDVSKPNKRNGG